MSSKGTTAFRFISLNLLLAFGLNAASQTANLSGAVRDSSQAIVIGASISISRESTGLKQTTSSSEQGLYRFAFLLPGTYTIAVEAQGFEVVSRAGVKLDPGQEARLDFWLSPAVVKQSVIVRGSASSLQTESPAVSTEVDPQLVRDLPLNGRTFQSLIFLAPGVVATSSIAGSGGGQFSVNGQRDTANYFTVDGVSANVGMNSGPFFVSPAPGGSIPAFNVLGQTHNLVSMDDMQEFKLQTSTYSAAYGRAAGGQLEIVTHSGSNQFHGSLFDYFRNDALDANDWFTNAIGLPRAARRQNDFGGVFGGPILKNRTFFFFSYEGLRLRLPTSFETRVPSLSARQAATGASQQILNAFPLPNGLENPATMLASLAGSISALDSSDNTSIRIDHMVNQKLVVFGRYSEAPSTERLQRLGAFDLGQVNFRSVTLGTTLALSPTTASDLRVNYSRTEASGYFGLDSSGGAVPPPDSLLFPAPFASPGSSSLFVLLQGGPHLSVGRTADNLQRQGNLVSNTSILHGTHEVRFGADYRYLAPLHGPFDYRQGIRFAGVPGVLSGLAKGAGIQSFDSVTLGFHDLSLYGQDNWKVNRRLTIIYGLRWELEPPPHAKGNQQLLTVTGLPDLASMQIAPPGTPVYRTAYANFAPRLGAAYQLLRHPGRETVVRGGFGTYYDLGIGNIADAAASFPYIRGRATPENVPYPLSQQDAAPPPPVSLDPPYSRVRLNVFGPDHALPRSYHWNLTVDQRLDTKQVISASYVGEAGRRLLQQKIFFDPNALFVDMSQIDLATNASSSNYHALQVQFQRRMSRGLSALLSYTWSHSTDDVSTDQGGDYLPDASFDRGSSDFDVRHAFNAAFTYDIPTREWKPALGAVLKDWSMDAIYMAKAALPVNVLVDRGDIGLASFLLQARPDPVPGVPLYVQDSTLPGGRRINPAAFSVPIEPRQGNLRRNALRGFSLSQLDFDVRRQFSITEAMKLQLRVDLFNIFNHPNFVTVDNYFGFLGPPLEPNPNFGVAAPPVGSPRSIQLSLRLRF
jgi:hypothetical protein